MRKSLTGKVIGRGSMPYRRISWLTETERQTVRNGEIVYVDSGKTHYTQSGYKIVTFYYGLYGHREPTPAELGQIQEMEASLVS